MMPTNTLIVLSQALRDLPYDFRAARYSGHEGGFAVELYTKDGLHFGSGKSERSFLDAFTRAEIDLKRNMAAQPDPADFDEDEAAMFLQGTRGM